MDKSQCRHLVLTRWNVPWGSPYVARTDPVFLKTRLMLFARTCYPSLLRQSCQNFTWLGALDEASPDWLKQELAQLFPRMQLVIADWRTHSWSATVTPYLNQPWLLTTRIDNDDFVHRDFVRELQAAWRPVREALSMPVGFSWQAGRSYRRDYINNPFVSLNEAATTAGNVRTVYCRMHTRIHEAAPVRTLTPRPRWGQLVHGHNAGQRPVAYPESSRLAVNWVDFGIRNPSSFIRLALVRSATHPCIAPTATSTCTARPRRARSPESAIRSTARCKTGTSVLHGPK